MISHLDHLMDSTPEPYKPATCCPKCYDVMTDLKQEIAELEKTIESRERQIDKQQSQISKLITAYERKLDALGSLQAVEIDLQAVLNEVQPLLPF
jgi:chromosome segregation ATPase